MIDISTKYMGLSLRSPLVVSASPLSQKVENIVAMQESGAGAVVMFSLFEEQIDQAEMVEADLQDEHTFGSPRALNYFQDDADFKVGIDEYLKIIEDASKQVDIPIIGSLNGISQSGWINYAKQIEAAGASGLEINVYYLPANIATDGRSVENRYLEIVKLVKESVTIPVAIKLNPYFSSMAHMAKQFETAGANALVLFNRFYEPDFNIETMSLEHTLTLSDPNEIRLPLLWLSILHGRVDLSLAASTGVRSSKEIIKFLLAGADCVMTASALLKHGIQFIKHLLDEVQDWMRVHDFESIAQWKGKMSQRNIADPTLYDRANYLKVLGGHKIPTLK